MANFTFSGNNGKISTSSASALKMNASSLLSVVQTMELTFVVSGGKFLLSLNGVTSQVKSWLDAGYKMQIQTLVYRGGLRRTNKVRFGNKDQKDALLSSGYTGPFYDYSEKQRVERMANTFSLTSPNNFQIVETKDQFGNPTSYSTIPTRLPINRYKSSGFKSMDATGLLSGICRNFQRVGQDGSFTNNDLFGDSGFSFKYVGFSVLVANQQFAFTGPIRLEFDDFDTSLTNFAFEEGSATDNLVDEELTFNIPQIINGEIDSDYEVRSIIKISPS